MDPFGNHPAYVFIRKSRAVAEISLTFAGRRRKPRLEDQGLQFTDGPPEIAPAATSLTDHTNTRRIPSRDRTRGYIARHDARGPDDGIGFDGDSRENHGTAADPHIASNLDGTTQFGARASYRRIARMVSGINLHCRADLSSCADRHCHHIENHAIEIEKYTRA